MMQETLLRLGEEPHSTGSTESVPQPQSQSPKSTNSSKKSVTTTTALEWHEQLRTFEAQRRSKNKSKLESIPLYWQSHQDLLEDSILETGKAYRLIVGISKAHARLAQLLQQSDDNELLQKRSSSTTGGGGGAATAAPVVETSDNDASPRNNDRHSDDVNCKSNSNSNSQSHDSTEDEEEGDPEKPQERLEASLENSHTLMKERFGESAEAMEKGIVPHVQKMQATLEERLAELREKGKNILQVLQKVEAQVGEAWGKLQIVGRASQW
jgi:hypothetical protein